VNINSTQKCSNHCRLRTIVP